MHDACKMASTLHSKTTHSTLQVTSNEIFQCLEIFSCKRFDSDMKQSCCSFLMLSSLYCTKNAAKKDNCHHDVSIVKDIIIEVIFEKLSKKKCTTSLELKVLVDAFQPVLNHNLDIIENLLKICLYKSFKFSYNPRICKFIFGVFFLIQILM